LDGIEARTAGLFNPFLQILRRPGARILRREPGIKPESNRILVATLPGQP
jgi:hypothetical protein